MSDDVIVTMAHVRKAKMCSRGSRSFCERHGIDWNKFLEQGIPASELLKTGDAMIEDLVEVARGGI